MSRDDGAHLHNKVDTYGLGMVLRAHSAALIHGRRADAKKTMRSLIRTERCAQHEEADSSLLGAVFPHAWASRISCPRIIYRLRSANNVCSCCVFFIKPR